MQNLAKRQWGHSLSVKDSADIMIDWCVRARDKNILRKKPPQIYFAYVLEDTPPLQYFQNISPVFKYSQKDVPYIDQTRDSLLRCLSVALKAHFFLFPNDAVSHEPYFFVMPSLLEPSQTHFGLLYKIEKEDKVILVCEKNLKAMIENENNKVIFEFPTVVIEDSFKWYHMKNWYRLKQQANLDGIEKPWQNKGMAELAKDAPTPTELQKYATLLEVPYEIKDAIKPLGIEWSAKVKTWYLPKGFDVDSVKEYIDYTRKEWVRENPNGVVKEQKPQYPKKDFKNNEQKKNDS
jgi:Domain of unknown function (DUF5710)